MNLIVFFPTLYNMNHSSLLLTQEFPGIFGKQNANFIPQSLNLDMTMQTNQNDYNICLGILIYDKQQLLVETISQKIANHF